MAKKRVHELAKLHNLPSAEVLKRLAAAGIEVKAAASAVDEDAAAAAIAGKKPPKPAANGAKARPVQPRPQAGNGPLRFGPLGRGEGPPPPRRVPPANQRPDAPGQGAQRPGGPNRA